MKLVCWYFDWSDYTSNFAWCSVDDADEAARKMRYKGRSSKPIFGYDDAGNQVRDYYTQYYGKGQFDEWINHTGMRPALEEVISLMKAGICDVQLNDYSWDVICKDKNAQFYRRMKKTIRERPWYQRDYPLSAKKTDK